MQYALDSQNVIRRKTNVSMKSSQGKSVSFSEADVGGTVSAECKDASKQGEMSIGDSLTNPAKKKRSACRSWMSKKCIFIILIVVVLATMSLSLGVLSGVLKHCLDLTRGPGTDTDSNVDSSELVPERELHPYFANYISKHTFNFTTANEYSVVGMRTVLYCRDVRALDTLCITPKNYSRSVFIAAHNANVNTRRFASEVYHNLQDFLNWTAGANSSDDHLDRLHEVVLNVGHEDDFYQVDEFLSSRENPSKSPSSANMVKCSQKLIYENMTLLIAHIVRASSTVMNDRGESVLENMFGDLTEEEENSLRDVMDSREILNSSLELELSSLMKQLSECSSAVWSTKDSCSPCREVLILSSKYPKREKVVESEVHHKESKSTMEILDTLLLYLSTNSTCVCK